MSTYRNQCTHGCRSSCDYCTSCPCPVCSACPPECCTPAGRGAFLNGFQAQLNNAADMLLEENHNVVFNLVINQASSNIIYNNITGQFTLSANKNYYVSWWVAVNGSDTVSSVEFAAAINNSAFAIASSPLVTCQLSGSALIPVAIEPQILSIMNVSKNPVRYAVTAIQANIVIIELAVKGL